MKNAKIHNDFTATQVVTNKNKSESISGIEEEIEQLKMQFSQSEKNNNNAWSSSILRVWFKNETFARKYRMKIEKFLKELLEEGEEFVVYHPPHKNDEKQCIEENHQSFRIDKVTESSERKSPPKVPVYSSEFEDTLECDKEEIAEKVEEEKPSMFTCFNCLGDHHMKKCPEKLDWPRINANKKEILLSGTTIRYHTDDQNNGFSPGVFSNNLREALELKENQLPKFIYHMRVIGYPPGWMEEAIFEKSGLSLFDHDGKAINDEPSSAVRGTLYDGSKFIDFPGFNTPVPKGFSDEWKVLNMPPLQAHQQLQEALRSPNIINKGNVCKRRQSAPGGDIDMKKQKNAQKNCDPALTSTSLVGNNTNNSMSPKHSGRTSLDFKTPDSKSNRHSMSISMSPGTPVLDRGNPYNRLPAADKFAQGITEHLPFENLPDSVGTYEKMRGVISCVQRKLNDIKDS